VMKNLKKQASGREDRIPKTLFTHSQCRIAEDDGFRDLLSRSRMHVDERDEVALAVQQRRRQKTRCIGGSRLFIVTYSMAGEHIYREDIHMVTTSHNQLDPLLSKRIRHGLIAKINDKRRPRIYEDLGQIFAEYSRARRAPKPIASPHHATPHPALLGPVR
jgi:hypothetical protein